MNLTYNEVTDTFTGSSLGTQNEFTNGSSCTLMDFTCNGDITLVK